MVLHLVGNCCFDLIIYANFGMVGNACHINPGKLASFFSITIATRCVKQNN